MSRISTAFHLTILLLPSLGAVLAAPPARAAAELRRLPLSFAQLAPKPEPAHRLVPRKAHHSGHKPAPAEDDSDALVRAANLLAVNGYTDIKALRVDGDQVTADVTKDDEAQKVVVTKEGEVAVGQTASIDAAPTADEPSNATASDTAAEPVPPASAGTPESTNAAPSQAAAAGRTSEAASPGALSASKSTP